MRIVKHSCFHYADDDGGDGDYNDDEGRLALSVYQEPRGHIYY